MTKTGRNALLPVAVLALALTAAACGSSVGGDSAAKSTTTTAAGAKSDPAWDAALASAKTEGSVTLYASYLQTQLDALKTAWDAAYPGITLNMNRLLAHDSQARIEAERTAGKAGADVEVSNDELWPGGESQAGRLAKTTGPQMKELKAALHPNGDYFISSYNVTGFCWNTTMVKQPPTKYEDLLRPEFSNGKIALIDPLQPASADWWLHLKRQTKDDQFFQKVAAAKPRIYGGSQEIMQAVASGEASVSGFCIPSLVDALKAKGAPIELAFPAKPENGWGTPFVTSVLSNAPHPNAAQVLANFMVSVDGQKALAASGATVLTTEVPGAFGTLDKFDVFKSAAVTTDQYNAFYADWRKTFGR
jgi:iron(III) transport system substrate-binding protein